MSRHELTPSPPPGTAPPAREGAAWLPGAGPPGASPPETPPEALQGVPFGAGRAGYSHVAGHAGLAGHAALEAPTPRRERAGDVLLVTASPVLRGEVERIVAAAGAGLRVAGDAGTAAGYWDEAAAVLVGSDVRELPPRRRAPAVVVGLDGEGDSLWHLAAVLGAERVAVLPDAAAWLADHLSRSRSPDPGGLVLGITGGCGGAGATTAAVWIAQAAAGLGARVMLVDGDPWGGGLELALAAEEDPGLRWPDLAGASGSVDPLQLADSLPVAGGFSFLSWPASRDHPVPVPAVAVAAVLDAARRGYELVVVDIGRNAEQLASFAWDCDRILVVVPAQLKAAVAAARLLKEFPPVEAALLVRGRRGAALDGPLIAEAVGLPVEGRVPELRSVAAAMESGRLLELGKRRAVRHFAASVLDSLGDVLAGDLG